LFAYRPPSDSGVGKFRDLGFAGWRVILFRMVSLTPDLERAMEHSLAIAAERGHEYATLEHLLFTLLSDADALDLLKDVNVANLKSSLTRYLDGRPRAEGAVATAHPTAAFQRVVQRAVLRCESVGRGIVTGADIVASIPAEKESEAARLLDMENFGPQAVENYLHRRSGDARSPHIAPPEAALRRIAALERQLGNALDRIALLEEHVCRLIGK
jgi:ATP-dependent Clp protease ATP-binding subunit ClpA